MAWFSTKKTLKIAGLVLCVLTVLAVGSPGFVLALVGPTLDRMKGHCLLSQAKTPDELRAAVGSLGAFFPLPDGGWVAVRYRDSHASPGYSYAVAHDCGGQWYYSRRHFCGRFRNYFRLENQTREFAMAAGQSEAEILQSLERTEPQMFRLATATNLAAAPAQLLAMGFSQ